MLILLKSEQGVHSGKRVLCPEYGDHFPSAEDPSFDGGGNSFLPLPKTARDYRNAPCAAARTSGGGAGSRAQTPHGAGPSFRPAQAEARQDGRGKPCGETTEGKQTPSPFHSLRERLL